MKNKNNFTLPATHQFCIKSTTPQPKNDTSIPGEAGSSLSSISGTSGGLIGSAAGFARENKEKTKSVLEHHKSNAEDSDMSSFCSDLQNTWGLN